MMIEMKRNDSEEEFSTSQSFHESQTEFFNDSTESSGKYPGISEYNLHNEEEYDLEQQPVGIIEASVKLDLEISTSELQNKFELEQQHIGNIERDHSPSSEPGVKSSDKIDHDHPQRANRNLVIMTSEAVNSTVSQTDVHLASPQIRKNQLLPLESPTVLQRSKRKGIFPLESKKNKRLPFRIMSSLVPFVMGVLALTTSIINRQSHDFVKLSAPIEFDDRYQEVYKVGLYYIEICRADKLVSMEMGSQSISITELEYANDDHLNGNPVSEKLRSISLDEFSKIDPKSFVKVGSPSDEEKENCNRISISSFSISDTLWNISRILAGVSQWTGALSLVLMLGFVVYEKGNFTIVYSLIFLSYMLQGSVFFFYDSFMCQTHGCSFSTGTYYAISAVVCWFLSGIGVLLLSSTTKRNRTGKKISHRKKRKSFAENAVK
jgi:hypothetical protein